MLPSGRGEACERGLVWLGSTAVDAGPGDGAGMAEETEGLRCRDGPRGLLGYRSSQEVGGASVAPVFPNCILSFHRAS